MTEQRSPREMAEHTLREREDSERRAELDRLERSERQRRADAEQLRVREAAREAASQKAAELAGKRREVEEKIEEQVKAMNTNLAELQELDRRHRKAMMEAGTFGTHSLHHQPLSRSVDTYLQHASPGFLSAKSGVSKRESLAALDPLTDTPPSEPAGRPQPQGLPASTLEGSEARDSVRLANKLLQRAEKMFLQYGRPVRWNECVVEGERDEVARILDDEQKAALASALSGEYRRGE